MLDNLALDTLFRSARTHNSWSDAPLREDDLRALYDLVKMGPTSANCSPARFAFVQSAAARERLAKLASGSNPDKIRAAPVTVIIGYDTKFYDRLPELFPHADARSWFTGAPQVAHDTAFRNSSLQGGYLIMAARAMGLDCGPMSGFDASAVDAEFWAGTDVRTNFICSIGKGTNEGLHPRGPRLTFEDAARIL